MHNILVLDQLIAETKTDSKLSISSLLDSVLCKIIRHSNKNVFALENIRYQKRGLPVKDCEIRTQYPFLNGYAIVALPKRDKYFSVTNFITTVPKRYNMLQCVSK